jgi:hypothetical protein
MVKSGGFSAVKLEVTGERDLTEELTNSMDYYPL